jgi:hypothetical protein
MLAKWFSNEGTDSGAVVEEEEEEVEAVRKEARVYFAWWSSTMSNVQGLKRERNIEICVVLG